MPKNPYKVPSRQFTVRLPKPLLRDIEQQARAAKMMPSEFVRAALTITTEKGLIPAKN